MTIDKRDIKLLKNTKLNGQKKFQKLPIMKNLQTFSETENVKKLLCIGFIILLKTPEKNLNNPLSFYLKCHKNMKITKMFYPYMMKNTLKFLHLKEVAQIATKTKDKLIPELDGQNGHRVSLIQQLLMELIHSGPVHLLLIIDKFQQDIH